MQFSIRNVFKSLWEVEPEERLKTLYLGVTFFFIIFSYTFMKELKDSIFMGIIGSKNYIAGAKILTLFALVPLVFFYSKLVDSMRRYQLLCFCATLYSCVGIVCALLVAHPTIGLCNTVASPNRVFGWLFYFYVESFTPLVLSVFWAFLNSISNPKAAKKNYGLLISFSKVGGMLSAGLGWLFLYYGNYINSCGMSDMRMIQAIMLLSSLSLLLVPITILMMMKKVPGKYLHGYEVAYQFEKKQSKAGKEQTGIFSGLMMLIKYPYTFGIFGLVLFYEVLSSVLSFQRLGMAQDIGCGVAGTSCFLLGLSFAVHCVGFFISFLGTRMVVSRLGERLSLLVVPVTMGTLLFYYLFASSIYSLLICFVVTRAVYYALHQPITEALYIPTVKSVKFKSKSWIDTFGKKSAKGIGWMFNGIIAIFGQAWKQVIHTGLFGVVIGVWIAVAYFLGKRFHRAIKNNEVIGSEEFE